MKHIDEYVDSSDDEETVEINPYVGVSLVTDKDMKHNMVFARITNIGKFKEILEKKAKSHQALLTKNAVPGPKKTGNTNRSESNFLKPLNPIKNKPVPSVSSLQHEHENTIVPAFRGLFWADNSTGKRRFVQANTDWEYECHFSSLAFRLANIGIEEFAESVFKKNHQDKTTFKGYDLNSLGHLDDDEVLSAESSYSTYKDKLEKNAILIKTLFSYAESIKLPFKTWKKIFTNMRNSTKLCQSQEPLSLASILSYWYTNEYAKFKACFSNLSNYFEAIQSQFDDTAPVDEFINCWNGTITNQDVLNGSLPFVSEGQIPRHALLYAFGVKQYGSSCNAEANPLYTRELKPTKPYLGKVFITANDNTLFSRDEKPIFLPDFDKQYGGGVIGKTIIGEKEIQHRGANLEGRIHKCINIKLPKFHHEDAPERYKAKYALNETSYKHFRETFMFLTHNDEHGKLSWMYLETVLMAHLIHFHELQLYKYCNSVAEKNGQTILWSDRKNNIISNPYKDEIVRADARAPAQSLL